MAIATLQVSSDLADGSFMHPTLPMSYLGEIVWLDGNNYQANQTIYFNTQKWYENPFFIFTYGVSRFFYYHIAGSGNSFSISFERAYNLAEGSYLFYSGERSTGVITNPMFTDGKLYVGASRG